MVKLSIRSHLLSIHKRSHGCQHFVKFRFPDTRVSSCYYLQYNSYKQPSPHRSLLFSLIINLKEKHATCFYEKFSVSYKLRSAILCILINKNCNR